MAEIFVSYAREDRDRVSTLARQLVKSGWTVWWDRQILAGKDFDAVVQGELDNARCVIVVWSAHSVLSRWVRAEAGEGLKREILVPVLLDGSSPPLAFRNIQTVLLLDSPCEPGSPAFDDLIASLTNLLGAPTSRPAQTRVPAAALSENDGAAPAPVPFIANEPSPVARADSSEGVPTPERRSPARIRYGAAAIAIALIAVTAGWYQGVFGLRTNSPTTKEDGRPAEPVVTSGQPGSEPTAPVGPPPTERTASNALSDANIQKFVREYVAVGGSGDVERALLFYGPRVDYFAKGIQGQDYIRRDKRGYFKDWPKMKHEIVGDVSVTDAGTPTKRLVKFRSSYEVESPQKGRRSGTVENTLIVALLDGALKIVYQRGVTQEKP